MQITASKEDPRGPNDDPLSLALQLTHSGPQDYYYLVRFDEITSFQAVLEPEALCLKVRWAWLTFIIIIVVVYIIYACRFVPPLEVRYNILGPTL